MYKNYLKTAWRNLLKNKFYSFITIAGLTIGLAVGMLILLWVQDERGFNNFHKQARNIYKLENRVGTGSSQQIWSATAAPIGVLARNEIPDVKDVARITNNYFYSLFKYNDKVFTETKKVFTDPAFFSIFDFPLVKGNPALPFPDDHSIVITETTARRYFADNDPMGKVIVADDSVNFTVTGVIRDLPKNSDIQTDMLFPMTLLNRNLYQGKDDGRSLDNDFIQFNYETYLLLAPGTSLQDLPVKLRNIHLRNKADDTDIAYLLLPLAKRHLYKSDGTAGGIESVRMFTIIALLILVIACINYVNLSTARSMLRTKEVSLRKIVGADKRQLFLQFVLETALVFLLATILAIGLISVLIPAFNSISGKELAFDLFSPHIWKVIGLTTISTLLISSIYPALLLSSFEPLKALKGKISVRISDVLFRKALVVTQFAFSVILITGTIVIGRQLSYIRAKALGYNKEYVMSFPMRNIGDHYEAVKADLLKRPGVLDVTRSGYDNIVNIGNTTGNNDYDGKGPNETFMIHPMGIDKDFIPFFQMKMQEGNNFSGAITDSSHVILNETAVREAGIKDPIGKRFRLWNNNATIIGVAKDFHYASMKEKIEPAIFYYADSYQGNIYIRTSGKDAARAVAAAGDEWKRYNANFPFTYNFLDEVFNSLYRTEERTGVLFDIFAGIAILISCLGLLGLTAYTAQIRTREIGVRKVLGSTVTGIVGLLAKDFIRLVLISIIIAIPIAWYAMNKWLEDFAYKIDIGWSVFLISGLLAIFIAVLTISVQSVKAALANPIKSLRIE